MFTASVRDVDTGIVVGVVVAKPKEFSTGSSGYFGVGKIEAGGKRYQAQVQLVEIGSKDRGASEEA